MYAQEMPLDTPRQAWARHWGRVALLYHRHQMHCGEMRQLVLPRGSPQGFPAFPAAEAASGAHSAPRRPSMFEDQYRETFEGQCRKSKSYGQVPPASASPASVHRPMRATGDDREQFENTFWATYRSVPCNLAPPGFLREDRNEDFIHST
ncbi:hypothetical protein WOLCODRAFT_160232 [Wolfiporia cocos MD-104 SS10]|uniref:Uncharacterized protein n=1 Tax=Wolfiporia cocos (strain MD-104) TaxID=742152 RepID=A0A2H3IUI5_WOLCO|nr:hypothetical protein WOLCODRAFT_160232 [Wolfiporia cocos MD-104 SS10]